jgi:hypothetical protein
VKIAGEILPGLAGLPKIRIFGIDLPDAVTSEPFMPRKKSLNQHREEYLKLTVEHLFDMLNAKASSPQAKKKELLEALPALRENSLFCLKSTDLFRKISLQPSSGRYFVRLEKRAKLGNAGRRPDSCNLDFEFGVLSRFLPLNPKRTFHAP